MKTEFEELLAGYLNGTMDRSAMKRLSALLKSDPALREQFAVWLNLDAALSNWVRANPGRSAGVASSQTAFPGAQENGWLCVAFQSKPLRAALAVAAAVALTFWLPLPTSQSRGFARVESATGHSDFEVGESLSSEVHRLDAGALPLVTSKGVRLVIEAPATFQFESATKLRLQRGRLTAEVPPSGKGFTVVTPSGEAVDLGTRFGVDVPEAGDAEVHVFQGVVLAQAKQDRQRRLGTGHAVALTSKGSADRTLRSTAFIQREELGSLSAGWAAGQRGKALEALARLEKDPALISIVDFESPTLQGTFRSVQGRWPGSRAPEFMSEGDHVAIDAGGNREWPQFTLALWARLDRLGLTYQSLLHTDGWSSERPGQVHWMLVKDATMRLGLFGNRLAPELIQRPPSLLMHGVPQSATPLIQSEGRWAHLATVYDAEAKTVRFYVNGRFDNAMRLEVALPARFGPSRIGNWDTADRKLSGRIDELVILGRAMSDAEISALYDAGNPYR